MPGRILVGIIWSVPQPDPLAVLGHEVRNLIATFVGFSELLLTHDWPPDKQREYLETMRDEGVRVSQFLNELLDLQRMEAGNLDLKLSPVDIAALLQFAVHVAGHDLRHPITLDARPNLPPVLAEPDRIQQVVGNLLSNARKYSPHGGPIRVTSRAHDGQVVVTVEDSGVGIPKGSLERVFDKFYRVQSLLHRDVRGTGLGLAICRQIVEAHGGRMWAESGGLGRGARFSFTLPAAPVGQDPAAQREPHMAAYTLEGDASPAMSPVTYAPLPQPMLWD